MNASGAGEAFHLVAVVRGERRIRPRSETGANQGLESARFRDLVVLLRHGPAQTGAAPEDDVLEHHRAVLNACARGAAVPAPWGVVFPALDDAANFLRDQYVPLDRALGAIGDRREYRLHLALDDPAEAEGGLTAARTEIYRELRRLARASLPLRPESPRTFTSAFLVDHGAADAFTDRVQEMRDLHPGIALELSGPWPAYDFVHLEFA